MHILRPFLVVLTLAGMVLIARAVLVPEDFGTHETGYMYGWYRKGNEKEWKDFPAKFRGKEYCQDCHAEPDQKTRSSAHRGIECENCHGPGRDHPADPQKLSLDRSRDLCLRCHLYLPYPTSQRAQIKGVNPDQHNPGGECVACHNPHSPSKPK